MLQQNEADISEVVVGFLNSIFQPRGTVWTQVRTALSVIVSRQSHRSCASIHSILQVPQNNSASHKSFSPLTSRVTFMQVLLPAVRAAYGVRVCREDVQAPALFASLQELCGFRKLHIFMFMLTAGSLTQRAY